MPKQVSYLEAAVIAAVLGYLALIVAGVIGPSETGISPVALQSK
jgi:hypothetical protein